MTMPARSRKNNEVPTIEWVTGAVGLAIVLGTLGFIAYEAFRNGPEEPRLQATIETSGPVPTGFSATVTVKNESRRAAAEVLVEGVLRSRDGTEVRSEVRLDYVAGLSTRRGTLVFPRAPDAGGVAVRIVGYTTP
jgi:uncharacterized protein (TIGR02588 family)